MGIRKELTVGTQEARAGLRDLIDAALEQNQHTTITRNARPVAVLVPYAWYTRQGNAEEAVNAPVATVVDPALPIPAFRVGGSDDPDRLDDDEQITDELWGPSGGCPCGRYHGQRDGAIVHCGWQA